MKLQIALDDILLRDAVQLIEKIQSYIDIIEIGTPLVYREGMRAVQEMKHSFPDKEVLADMKIADAGAYECMEALDAGADIVTVLAMTDLITVKACVDAADQCGKQICADMLNVSNIPDKVREMESAGTHILAVHTGTDAQAAGRTPLQDLQTMAPCVRQAKIAVAGGISTETLHLYKAQHPDIVIVGGGICHAADPILAAKELYEAAKAE